MSPMSPASTILDLTELEKTGLPAAAPEQTKPSCSDTLKDLVDRLAMACQLAFDGCVGCVCMMMCCPTKQRTSAQLRRATWPLHEE